MPPQRTHSKPTFTPMKTERSHQENQERAYVAASRRSDRSLEARIESARRASEIHKQRTGRSLRITESAVLNEEMYEEDDDDLPAHMRRLTAHLRLNQQDADLDRRLGSLLVSQIGMRQALPMMQQPGFYRYSPNGSQQSAFAPPQSLHQPIGQPPGLNTNWAFDSGPHSRHGSISTNTQVTSPVQGPHSPHQRDHPAGSVPQSPYQQQMPPFSQHTHPRHDSFAKQHSSSLQSPAPLQETSPFVYGSQYCHDNDDFSPLSATLPIETQQILAGSNFDFNDPTLGMLMHNSDEYLRNGGDASGDEKELDTQTNDEQFGAFWNDVMLGL